VQVAHNVQRSRCICRTTARLGGRYIKTFSTQKLSLHITYLFLFFTQYAILYYYIRVIFCSQENKIMLFLVDAVGRYVQCANHPSAMRRFLYAITILLLYYYYPIESSSKFCRAKSRPWEIAQLYNI